MNFVVFEYSKDDIYNEMTIHSYHKNTSYENVIKELSKHNYENIGFIVYDLDLHSVPVPKPDNWTRSKVITCTLESNEKFEFFDVNKTNIKTVKKISDGKNGSGNHFCCALFEVIEPLESAKEKLTENELEFFKKRITGVKNNG